MYLVLFLAGKTAAFMLPILERLLYKPKTQPVSRVLVLLPTRELAVQVHQVSRQLSQFTKVTTALAAGKYRGPQYVRVYHLYYSAFTQIRASEGARS